MDLYPQLVSDSGIDQYFTAREMVDAANQSVHEAVSDVARVAYLDDPAERDFTGIPAHQMLMFDLFRSTEMNFDTSTGKIQFKTKSKNLYNNR